jgi:hypothetical protein
MPNKQIKPVFFASKRINVHFIFAYIRFEQHIRVVLVQRDGVTPPLTPLYDGLFMVLGEVIAFLQAAKGDRTDNVSTLWLRPCRSPPDVAFAVPPRRGRPRTAPPYPPGPPTYCPALSAGAAHVLPRLIHRGLPRTAPP